MALNIAAALRNKHVVPAIQLVAAMKKFGVQATQRTSSHFVKYFKRLDFMRAVKESKDLEESDIELNPSISFSFICDFIFVDFSQVLV